MHQETPFSSVAKRMGFLKASKKTSTAVVASKFKYRSLNTSCLSKASLKSNNKALAMSLQLQKERSRDHEKRIVCLQKEVQSLHLDLANSRHKHKNLILILKDLHSSALHHLGRVAEFVSSDMDASELFHGEERFSPDADEDYIQMERQTSVDLTEENTPTDPSEIEMKDGTSDMEMHLSKDRQCGQRETICRSNSLEEKSSQLSQLLPESDPVPRLQSRLLPSVVVTSEEPWPSVPDDVIDHPSSSDTDLAVLEHGMELDRTTLLDTPMEMTISDGNSEIVTVETKPKKTGTSKNCDKPKQKKERHKMRGRAFVRKDKVNEQKKQAGRSCEDEKSRLPVPDAVIDHPSGSDTDLAVLEHGMELDRTTLLDTPMEMTISDGNSEIVTVETKPTRTGTSKNCDKPKQKERRKMKDFVKTEKLHEQKKQPARSCEDANPEGRSSENLDLTEMQRAPVGTDTKPLQRNTHIISRIPKLSKVCDPQKSVKDNFRPYDSVKPIPVELKRPNTVSPEQDHFVEREHEEEEEDEEKGAILVSEEDIAKEESSKTKSRRETFVITSYLPAQCDDDESEKRENESDNAAHQDQPLYEDFLAYPDDHTTQPELGHTHCPTVRDCVPETTRQRSERHTHCPTVRDQVSETTRQRSERRTDSAKNFGRCRETFLASVTRDSSLSNSAASEAGAVEPHFNCAAEETFQDVCVVEDVCEQSLQSPPPMGRRDEDVVEEAQTTGKRSWLATQEPANIPEDVSKHNHDVPPFHHPSVFITDHRAAETTAVQRPKKARTEARARSSKKTSQNEEPKGHVTSRRRKTHQKGRSTQGLLQDDARYPLFSDNLSPYEGRGRAAGTASPKPLQTQNRCRETGVMEATSPQDPTGRSSCFAPTCTSQKNDSIRTSDVSVAEMREEDARREAASLGDFLVDERPPWESLDVSAAEMDVDGLASHPRRSSDRGVVYKEPTAGVTADASPAGRALTSLTLTPDNGNTRRARRCNAAVSYKEPTLNSKMRRGENLSDKKDKKTKKKSKKKQEKLSQS